MLKKSGTSAEVQGMTLRARLLAATTATLAVAGLSVAPAATGASAYVTEGRAVAPVVVDSPQAARWLPGSRHTISQTTQLGTVAPAVTAPNLTATHAGSYAFMSEVAPGDPIRWSACSTVHWTFNPNHAPAGGLTAISSVVARVAAATGLHFVYDGSSASVPTSSYISAQTVGSFRPLLIGWSTAAESTLLAGQVSNLVGMDQAVWSRDASGSTRIQSGVVALNAAVTARTSGANSWYTFALHELGHAVGLAHTTDSTQITNAMVPPTASDYGSGDLTGLHRLGGVC